MKRKVASALLLTIALAFTAAPASADYFISERQANALTKDAVNKRYGYNRYRLGTSCKPQGRKRPEPGYIYHRWVCAWAIIEPELCDYEARFVAGELIIAGNSGTGRYSHRVHRGAHCRD